MPPGLVGVGGAETARHLGSRPALRSLAAYIGRTRAAERVAAWGRRPIGYSLRHTAAVDPTVRVYPSVNQEAIVALHNLWRP